MGTGLVPTRGPQKMTVEVLSAEYVARKCQEVSEMHRFRIQTSARIQGPSQKYRVSSL